MAGTWKDLKADSPPPLQGRKRQRWERVILNVGRFHSVLPSVSFQAHVNVSVSFFPPSSPFLSPLSSPEMMDGQLVTAFPMWRNRNTNTYRSNNRTCQPRFRWRQSEILVRPNKCLSPLNGLVGKLAWWLKWKSFFQTSMRISVIASCVPGRNHRLGQEVKYTVGCLLGLNGSGMMLPQPRGRTEHRYNSCILP